MAASIIHIDEMYDSNLASSSACAICGMVLLSLSLEFMSTDDAREADHEAIRPRGGTPAEASAADATDSVRAGMEERAEVGAVADNADDAVRWRERVPQPPPPPPPPPLLPSLLLLPVESLLKDAPVNETELLRERLPIHARAGGRFDSGTWDQRRAPERSPK